jgi:D-sedoheptulose 7-phosphate isomerase
MANLNSLFSSDRIEDFSKSYFKYLSELLEQLDPKNIKLFVDELEKARKDGRTIFVAGNGGSAATASHIANDIGMVMMKQENIQSSFRVLSISDNISLMTALGNDYGYEDIFVRQLQIHFKPGDVLIVISASGNSENLVRSAKWVKENNGTVIGLLGFDGGKLLKLSNIAILAKTPKGEYGPVEDVHMILDHLVTTWLLHKYENS